jgi:hypothetical protein
MGTIAVIGSGGLLGEIVAMELVRHGPLSSFASIHELVARAIQLPDVIAIWADASELGLIRTQLRSVLPAALDPLLVFLSQSDPYIYFTRLRALHVDRRRLGFSELFDEISVRLSTGHTTSAPVRAGLV